MTVTRSRFLTVASAILELALLWYCWPILKLIPIFVYRTLDHFITGGALTGA